MVFGDLRRLIIFYQCVAVSVGPRSSQPIEVLFGPFIEGFRYDLIIAYQCLHIITESMLPRSV